jgi:FkbM family methyltransferase
MRPVNTRELFIALLRELEIDIVCDVGSMNGDDALAFRASLPQARVMALEPNPDNLRHMRADARLQRARIEIIGAAASNTDSRAPFFLVDADYATRNARRGMSSLHQRDPGAYPTTAVEVETLRLETLLAPALRDGARVALWIDTEGHACEVLEGLGGIARHITMLHVELESQPCISSTQRLYPEARALLESMRFEELATDHAHAHPQFNALFIRRGLDARARQRVAARLSWAGLRQGVIDSLGQLCPGCHRRLAAVRSRVMRWRDQRRSAKQPASESLT